MISQISKLLCSLLLVSLIYGGENISFKHLTVDDGLSQNTISTTLHDSRGFMWFGTQDGLNRYDGYEFRVFRHEPGNAASIGDNWIWSVREDSNGYIWACTFGGGLSRFDRYSEEFISFQNDPENSKSISHNTVWDIVEHPKGIYWVATNNGLNRMSLKTNRETNELIGADFEYLPHDSVNNNIFRILLARDDYLWLTSPLGLYRFNIQTKTYKFYDLTPNTNTFHRYLGSAGSTNREILWLTSGEGLFRFNTSTQEIKHFKHDPQNQNGSIVNDKVVSVLEANDSIVWVGTTTSLTLIYPNGQFRQLSYDPLNQESLSHDFISSVYQDRNGLIWLGTRSGLDYCRPGAQKFKHIRHNPKSSNTISSSSVITFLEDSFGYLWIGTNDGLNRFDPNTGKYRHFFENKEDPTLGPSSSYILSIIEDYDKNLWIGTRGGGVCRWIRKTGRFIHYTKTGLAGVSTGTVLLIQEDFEKNIWIGTNGAGLHLYDKDRDTFIQMPFNIKTPTIEMNDISVFSTFIDSKGVFYVGTAAGGINIFDKDKRTFTHIINNPDDNTSLSNNRVISFLETRTGDIWVGTAQGLNKMIIDERKEGATKYSFKQYLKKDGLPNEVIYGILEDDLGYLWISTNKGVAKIDVSTEELQVRSFTVDDGLQSNEFNQNAIEDSKGRMYFGGINGYNVFDPLKIKLNNHRPPILLTHLKIIDKEIVPGKSSVLKKSISETKSFSLPWVDNVFSLEFAALDFTTPRKNQYAYKMEGFDKDWIYSGNRRFVTYTNLDPGEYVFLVKGSNNDGIWNEKGTSVAITVTPPPWKTWWAYSLYIFIGMLAVAGIVNLILRKRRKELQTIARIERAKSEERARVRKKASVDFHDEAGNLITKISLFVELTKRKLNGNTEAKDYLEKIEDNTKLLSGGMRDFIWSLDPGKDNLFDTLSRLEDFGNSMFEFSNIDFRVTGRRKEFKNINLAIDDRRAILLIFKEAMNNCLKYSNAKNAFLKIDYEPAKLKITFSDNGKGFSSKSIENGYGLTNMKNRAKKINALFTIDSSVGMGTKLIFTKSPGNFKEQ